ncbi:2-oxoglutarate dehydrogenase E1 component, partial [Massospora cicadina]
MLLSKLVRLKASRTFTFNLGRALKHASAVDNPTPRDFLDNSGSTFTDEPTVRHNLRLKTLKEANLDPLKLSALVKTDIGDTGFSTEEGEVELGRDLLPGYYLGGVVRLPVKEVLAILQKFGHLSDAHKVQWLQERVESPAFLSINHGERVLALERLSDAESFERIFAAKFPTVKRYGIEGADALLPALKAIVDRCGEVGVGSVVVGMPHRGRLNVYTHLMGRPAEEVFAEFGGKADPPHPWSGDAAYHLAVQAEVMTPAAKKVRVALMANPSHLEAVYPVALGAARARQDVGEETLPVIVHGDAAVAGQGVVYEALGLHQLDNYKTGGS